MLAGKQIDNYTEYTSSFPISQRIAKGRLKGVIVLLSIYQVNSKVSPVPKELHSQLNGLPDNLYKPTIYVSKYLTHASIYYIYLIHKIYIYIKLFISIMK